MNSKRATSTGTAVRLAAAGVVALLAGCAVGGPRFAYVDSVAAPGAPGQTTYYLISSIRGVDLDSPDNRRFRDMAHEALAEAGYTRVATVEEAELVIAFGFGVSRTEAGLVIERTSYANLTAFDWEAVSQDDARNAIWATRAYMEGSHGGAAHVVELLLEAAVPYIGTSTGGALLLELK